MLLREVMSGLLQRKAALPALLSRHVGPPHVSPTDGPGQGGLTGGSHHSPGLLHRPPARSVWTQPGDGGRGFSAWPRADVSR